MQWLIQRRPIVMRVLIFGGLLLMAVGLIVLIRAGLPSLWATFPVGGGLFLLGLVFVGCGLWALLTNVVELTAQQMRILVLILGGLSGLVIALMTGMKIYQLWSDIFAGGIQVWQQSEKGWKLWTCIYVELTGLVLMFASLLLVRGDVRDNAVLRRLLYGYNSVVTGVLVLAMLVLLNVLTYAAFPLTFEWTKTRGLYSLSDSSKSILENLKESVKVYVLLSERDPFQRDTRVLLDNCQAYSPKFETVYIDPDRDVGEYQRLTEKYPELKREQKVVTRQGQESEGRGLLVVFGADEAGKRPHAFIPFTELGDRKFPHEGNKTATLTFRGEQALMEKIQLLSEKGKKPVVYFTQLNGEPLIDDRQSAGLVVVGDLEGASPYVVAGDLGAKLKRDNYDVRGLIWGPPEKHPQFKGNPIFTFGRKDAKATADAVPADADLVVILYAAFLAEARPYPPGGLKALEDYLKNRGGRLMVLNPSPVGLLDGKIIDTGVAGLVKKYGVQVQDDFLLQYNERLLKAQAQRRISPLWVTFATGAQNSSNKVARQFNGPLLEMVLARPILPASTGNFKAEALLEVRSPPNEKVWKDNDPAAFRNWRTYLGRLLEKDQLEARRVHEPVPVAVAVTDLQARPRLVVVGDSHNTANVYLSGAPNYYDFIRSSMEWLVERPAPAIGIAPKDRSQVLVRREDVKSAERMIWLPLGLMMLLVVGTGMGVWVVRRR